MNNAASTSSSGIELPQHKQNIYYKIRSIFPNINAEHIKDMIINPNNYGIQDLGNNEEFISSITENLLYNGADYVDVENAIRSSDSWRFEIAPAPDVQTERLIGIFPDADPEYLKKYAETNFTDPQSINRFIEDNLLEKNYPSRDDYVKRKKLENDYKKYFSNFSVMEFLKEIPNPVEYFENIDRICQDDVVTIAVLEEIFNNLDKSLIKDVYASSKFNPTLTSKNLEEKHKGILKAIDKESLNKLQNQIQEFSFICNRKLIENELQRNDSVEELIECESCFNMFPQSKCSTCKNDHIFCNQCIRSGTQYKINDGIYNILCFACNVEFPQNTLQAVLPPKLYNILMQKRQEVAIIAAAINNVDTCPFCAVMLEVNEESKILFCLNEDCKKQSCRRCKKINHLPYECKDVLDIKNARLYLEEKMTRALIRNCLQCGKQFLKSEGCNRMTCVCGASQCYLCDKPVSSNDYTHFNGQGADRHDLCPLYSDDKYQEAESVLEVAQRTKQEILKKNPDFDSQIIDGLLPKLPQRTEGPHQQIPNSNQLPERVLKVANAIVP